MDVHEAGGDDLAGGVDFPRRPARHLSYRAQRDDAVADYGEIAGPARRTRAVHQGAVANDQVAAHESLRLE